MVTSVTLPDLKINMAEQFKESVSEPSPNTKLYLTFGKTLAWANDASPNVANASYATIYEVWDNMIGAKRLLGGDISHVIPRYNWTSGETYIAYDHLNTSLRDGNTKFYVMNSEFSVYKCIANNRGQPSTVEPTSVSPYDVTNTSDGYTWKYMYTLSDAEQLRFTTSSYIPVKTLIADDGSTQWQVQSEAIDGAIRSIYIANVGSGYANSSNLSISLTGDGVGFSGIVSINTSTNTISSITITDPGSGYTFASATISDANTTPGTGAVVRPIISPPGGHGSNALYELGGKNIMINARLRYDEEGVLPVSNDFRQIGLLKDPYAKNSSNVISVAAAVQALSVTAAGSGNFSEDEYVYQGSTLSTSSFSGRVVSWNPATNKLLLINTIGTPSVSQSIIGESSFTARVITSTDTGAFSKLSGQLLWVDNIKPITRSSDQIESFNIVVKF